MLERKVEIELSEMLTELLGYTLGVDHIHSDKPGFAYYIQSLKPGYPVLVMHYRGPLMLVIPDADYQRLNNGEITVKNYIEESHFNYGYFWGGGGLLSGAYWQPLEGNTGINDKNRISRYLEILSCRTATHSHGYRPKGEQCQRCKIDETGCPFSSLNQTGCWDNEVQELDARIDLFNAIEDRLQEELGFEICSDMSHSNDQNELLLFPGYEPNSVKAFVNKELLNNLLYHPEQEYDWATIAKSFIITLGIAYQDERVLIPTDIADKNKFCLEFWGDKMHKEKEISKDGDEDVVTVKDASQKKTLLNLISDLIQTK